MKQCSKCKQNLNESCFVKDNSKPDRLCSSCKKCNSEYAKKYYASNKELISKRNKQWIKDHPGKSREYTSAWEKRNPDKKREIARKWDHKNPEKIKEMNRKHYYKDIEASRKIARDSSVKNKDKIKQRKSVWQKNNRDKANAAHHRYNSNKNGNGGSYSDKEWKALCEKYGHRCLRCGEIKPLTADHVVPVSKGGSSNISNIQPLCQSCNSGKRDKTIDYRPR